MISLKAAGHPDAAREETSTVTLSTIIPAGYFVTDNELIHGTGETADLAWADMLDTMHQAQIRVVTEPTEAQLDDGGEWVRESAFTIKPATAALIQAVKDFGGQIGWAMRNGVACTQAEHDGE